MAGIYIHIPFCRRRCHYCDFYFTTNSKLKTNFLLAIEKEITARKNELKGEKISTIYFGGGTPSQLLANEINFITEIIYKNFLVEKNAEITLEANPEDLSEEYINQLKATIINRFSVGIQSFDNEILRWLNREHNSNQAEKCIADLYKNGFENISIDLIYGIPGMAADQWLHMIEKSFSLPVKHLSCYSLTVEEKTPLYKMIKDGKKKNIDEELSVKHFEMLMDKAESEGWKHYEISNFSKENFYSRHNSSYWTGEKYLGFGPAAHSYNGEKRKWNIRSVSKYNENSLQYEFEILTADNIYNEFILSSLRTIEGIEIAKILKLFGEEKKQYIFNQIEQNIDEKYLQKTDTHILLTRTGKLFCDRITEILFI